MRIRSELSAADLFIDSQACALGDSTVSAETKPSIYSGAGVGPTRLEQPVFKRPRTTDFRKFAVAPDMMQSINTKALALLSLKVAEDALVYCYEMRVRKFFWQVRQWIFFRRSTVA